MAEIANATPSLTPHIVCAGAADAIEFYKKAFGAEELIRMPGEDGKLMHAAVSINGAMLMLVDENQGLGPAVAAVARRHAGDASPQRRRTPTPRSSARPPPARPSTMAAHDAFWGDRYGQVKDPFGHSWSMAHPLRDTVMSEDELREAAKDAMCGQAEPTAA